MSKVWGSGSRVDLAAAGVRARGGFQGLGGQGFRV